MARNKYTITEESVTVHLGSETYTIKRGDPNFEKARAAAVGERWDDIPKLISKGLNLFQWANQIPGFAYKDNHLFYNGQQLPKDLNERMLKMEQLGESPFFLAKFWEMLSQNPSYRSVQQVWGFLKLKGIPIDHEGYIICYKSVRSDYKDHHSGTVDNRVGQKPHMARNLVSDEYDVACHTGYHVGNMSFAKSFAANSRIIVVRIHPKDVVCVSKSNAEKMRVNEYEVIGNLGDQLPDTFYDISKDPAITQPPVQPKPKMESPTPKATDSEAAPMTDPGTRGEGFEDDEPWRTFGDLSSEELKDQNMENLRKYASRVLRIVGASKLRKFEKDDKGVEVGLVARIIDMRRPIPENS